MTPEIRLRNLELFLNKLEKDEGLTSMASVANKYDGVNDNYLSQLRNGNRNMGERSARKLEKLFDLPDFYFDKSENEIKEFNNINTLPQSCTLLAPVLNYVQAGHFCEYADDAIADEFEPYSIEYGEGCYWVVVQGKSMEPDFFAGDKVLIKKDISPSPGDYVVALAEGNEGNEGNKEATFKKYRPRGFDSTGREYCELVPSNPDFPVIDSRHMPFTICGVALERKQKLR